MKIHIPLWWRGGHQPWQLLTLDLFHMLHVVAFYVGLFKLLYSSCQLYIYCISYCYMLWMVCWWPVHHCSNRHISQFRNNKASIYLFAQPACTKNSWYPRFSPCFNKRVFHLMTREVCFSFGHGSTPQPSKLLAVQFVHRANCSKNPNTYA